MRIGHTCALSHHELRKHDVSVWQLQRVLARCAPWQSDTSWLNQLCNSVAHRSCIGCACRPCRNKVLLRACRIREHEDSALLGTGIDETTMQVCCNSFLHRAHMPTESTRTITAMLTTAMLVKRHDQCINETELHNQLFVLHCNLNHQARQKHSTLS